MFECICSCGKEGIFVLESLKKGHTKSCGCLQPERAKELFTTHGMRETRFYAIWSNMKARCNNKGSTNFSNYGGRGIKCLWDSFEEFMDDMYESYELHVKEFGNKNTTIERENVNGNYCRKNCSWATKKEQSNNTRRNIFLEFNGEEHTIKEWAKIYKIIYSTLYSRIQRNGWSIEKALTTPTID